jgi:hypothetical protein
MSNALRVDSQAPRSRCRDEDIIALASWQQSPDIPTKLLTGSVAAAFNER